MGNMQGYYSGPYEYGDRPTAHPINWWVIVITMVLIVLGFAIGAVLMYMATERRREKEIDKQNPETQGGPPGKLVAQTVVDMQCKENATPPTTPPKSKSAADATASPAADLLPVTLNALEVAIDKQRILDMHSGKACQPGL